MSFYARTLPRLIVRSTSKKGGGARSPLLSRATDDLLLCCHSRDVRLTARHVPGVLNIVADALSRPHSVLLTEGTLSHRVLCGPHCGRWVRLHLSGLLSRTRFDPVLMLSTLVVGVTGFSGALTTLFVQLTLREYNSPSF